MLDEIHTRRTLMLSTAVVARIGRLRRFLALLLAAASGCSLSSASGESNISSSEYRVKAAFLYNVINFVEWPQEAFAQPHEPLVIAVWGEDPFGSILDNTFKGESWRGRPIVVRRLSQKEENPRCHLLFVGSQRTKGLGAVLSALHNSPTLTVGETKDFTSGGGMISVVTDRKKLVFNVNLVAAERAGIQISSQMLKLAATVQGEKR